MWHVQQHLAGWGVCSELKHALRLKRLWELMALPLVYASNRCLLAERRLCWNLLGSFRDSGGAPFA